MKNQSIKGASAVLSAGVLWGFMGVFVRGLSDCGFSPLQIITIRVTVAAALMALTALIIKPTAFKIRLRDMWCFIGTGIVSLALFGYCYFTAIEYTSMSVAAILLYTAPVMVMIMSVILFKEKINLQKILCLCAALAGCVFVSGIFSATASVSPIALGLGLTSGFAYALYSIFGRFAINRGYGSMTVSLYTFVFACAALLIIGDVGGIVRIVSANTSCIPLLVAMGLFTAYLPYFLYTAGLERLESGKASIIASVEPVVATLCGMVFFREFPDFWGWTGVVLVIGAIVCLNISFKKR